MFVCVECVCVFGKDIVFVEYSSFNGFWPLGNNILGLFFYGWIFER